MSVLLSSSTKEPLTSEERWRRWERRGQDQDARFMRRLHRAFWVVVILAGVLLLVGLWR